MTRKAGRLDSALDLDALKELGAADGTKPRVSCRFSFLTQRRLVEAGLIEVGPALADSVKLTSAGRSALQAGQH
ncbi:MAG: hypothetical protein EXR72_07015 [Myxococcales bacterium]|nr:hypothetical protein [Myxococcales bacterium]